MKFKLVDFNRIDPPLSKENWEIQGPYKVEFINGQKYTNLPHHWANEIANAYKMFINAGIYSHPDHPNELVRYVGMAPEYGVYIFKKKVAHAKRKSLPAAKTENWIQESVNQHKEGALHKQLAISGDKNIPFTLLEKIRVTPIGETVKNPTKTGKKEYKVTRLLKQRAVWALNLKRISQKR